MVGHYNVKYISCVWSSFRQKTDVSSAVFTQIEKPAVRRIMNRENDYVRNVVMAANDDLCDLM